MNSVITCKHCNGLEYFGRMINYNGSTYCRACYKSLYKDRFGKDYEWDDLDGDSPDIESIKE